MGRLIPATLLFVVLASAGAGAVVPNSGAILDRASAAHVKVQSVRANFAHRPASGPSRSALAITILHEGERLLIRRDLHDLDAGTVSTAIWATGEGGPGKPAPIAAAPLWLRLLAEPPGEALLRRAGVDLTRTSLAMAGGPSFSSRDILWVVGAGPQEPDRPQVAFERETGRLRRVVEVRPDDARQVLAVGLDGWEVRGGSEGARVPWPTSLTIAEGSAASRRPTTYALEWLAVNAPIDEAELLAPLTPRALAAEPPAAPPAAAP